MCGFFASNDPAVTREHLPVLEHRIGFRGPDGQSGLVHHQKWILYHARLSIIGLESQFSQPYFTTSGSALVFNGEILNFEALASKHNIQSLGSDTQVLSQLLEIPNFDLNELEGFFAFAFINSEGELQSCSRDRFGVKPLFVHRRSGYITISSEASAISDIFGLSHSYSALEEFEVFRAPIFTGSYFEETDAVTPGSCLVNGKFFDSLDYVADAYLLDSEIPAKLIECVTNSVESRMVSDAPVGLLYSGGIDSNILDVFTEKSLPRFTGGFTGDYDLEFLKQRIDARSHVLEVSDADFAMRMVDMIELRKEPLSVPNEVTLSFLAQMWAKRGGKVLLSGEAADEFFGGYDRIYSWALNTSEFDSKKFLDAYAYCEYEEIGTNIRVKTEEFFDELGNISPFEKVRQFFLKKHLPVLFRRLDFALMYSGVEGREPFASFDLFKLSSQIDPHSLFGRGLGKFPLRTLAAQYLGQEFAFEPKTGFPVDVARIFTGTPAKGRLDNYKIWSEKNKEALK